MATKKKDDELNMINTLLEQFQESPPAFPLQLKGELYPDLAALRSKLTGLAQPLKDLQAAEEAEKDARQEIRGTADDRKYFLLAVVDYIKATFGAASASVARYNVKPLAARRALTMPEQVLKNARCAATRKARGTLGPRARRAIKVTDVPPVLIKSDGTATTAEASSAPQAGALGPPEGTKPLSGGGS